MSAAAASPLSKGLVTAADPAFARAVATGLTAKRKWLPASWLYDPVGSALFEVITLLPEYGLTRADAALLERESDDIVRAAGNPRLIVELGSGTGAKTRHILYAAARHHPVQYLPIDISSSALQGCANALASIHGVQIQTIAATYLDGVDQALAGRRPGECAMILFLGSTIGNFGRAQASTFLRNIGRRLKKDDTLLLGVDLVKPRAKLLSAYDDPTGVTAAFNLNLLARMNRELGGHFNPRQFRHEARYNERLSRVEMHLRSRIAQQIPIDALGINVGFTARETIWTESSHKFRAEEVRRLGEGAGWRSLHQWLDRDWGFTETLFQPLFQTR